LGFDAIRFVLDSRFKDSRFKKKAIVPALKSRLRGLFYRLAQWRRARRGVQLSSGLIGFRGLRMALDERSQLVDGGVFLAQLEQRKALRNCAGGAWAAGEAFENGVCSPSRRRP